MANYEVSRDIVYKDTRSPSEKAYQKLKNLNVFRFLILLLILTLLLIPGLWPLHLVIACIFASFLADLSINLPLRVPKDLGGQDPSEFFTVSKKWNVLNIFSGITQKKKYALAGGILYWGTLRADKNSDISGTELWSNNSDCRTHVFLGGTTGSGKSESLYGITYNSLCWGSGVVYADGKADISLPFTIWSLCRRMGREDDFLHLNLLSGDKDPYQDMVNEQNAIDLARSRGESEYFKPKSNKPRSNSLNPFFGGTADFQLQLLVSLLPKASGDGAQWQEKAINLADAIIRCLRYKHIRKEIVSGIEAFRHYMGLEELVKLYQESVANNFPEAATLPIYSYLKTGLSFDFNKIDSPSEWTDEVRTQHGYLTSQFSRTLAMMMDSYGAIYKVKYPEIDMTDVLLNNRILLISIPSMEKSPQEAESLGKLAISSIRLMMAESLGSNYEGDKEEILNARPTASPFPYPIITDELAYYYAQGLAVMYAQARSLGFMMVVAVQDIQGLQRGSAGEETASLLANTKFKCCLALEDTKDTYEMIKAAAGEGYFSTLSGYDYHNDILDGWGSSNKSQLQQRSRLEINDVKELDAGQGFLIFKDSLVEFSAFYIPDDAKHTTKLKPRINQFIQIEPPENKAILEQISIPIFRSKGFTAKVNNGILFHPEKLDQFSRIELIDPIRDSIRNASIDIWEQFEQDDSEEEFQIKIRNLTWEAALNGLKKANLQFEHNELYSSYLVAPLEESLQDVF